jgi:hypothetical protein
VVEGRAVERIGATFLEAHGLKGSDDNLGLVLRLTRPSRFSLETGASFDSDTLAERLRRYDGDLWRALESLGITRFLSPDGSFEEALSGLPSSTVHTQVAPAQVIELRDLDEVAWSWCIFTPRCIPRWRWVRDP